MAKNVYLISDGSGETAATMTRAALIHYSNQEVKISRYKNVRTKNLAEAILSEVSEKKGVVIFTIASPQLRQYFTSFCVENGIISIDLLGPLFECLDAFFNVESDAPEAGKLRTINESYYKRIEAIEYTVKHDDGKCLNDLDKADVILVGISRTSKTPLSIFLSHKGWKVANIPLVLGSPLPDELFKADQKKIVGLIIDLERLQRIRRSRLEKFGQDKGSNYASAAQILEEFEYAERLFKKNKRWPVFNVTDRALEETAAEIIRIVSSRNGTPTDVIF